MAAKRNQPTPVIEDDGEDDEDDPFSLPTDDDFEINLDGASNMVPPGEYTAVLTDIEKGDSKGGNPMWTWTWVGVSEPIADKSFKNFTALTPQALWKVAETIEAIGLGTAGSVSKFSKADAIGRLATLVIIDDEYDGRKRSTIKTVKAPPTGAGAKLQSKFVPS